MFEDLLEKLKENYYIVGGIVLLVLVVIGYFVYTRFYSTVESDEGRHDNKEGKCEAGVCTPHTRKLDSSDNDHQGPIVSENSPKDLIQSKH